MTGPTLSKGIYDQNREKNIDEILKKILLQNHSQGQFNPYF